MAFYSILQCIGQKFMLMVMSCRDPQEMWNTLCQFFECKTVSNKVYTLMQLYGLHMKKGTRISEHLRKIDKLSGQLEAIGERVGEVYKVTVLLRSVQEMYPTLVTALLAQGDDELTLVFVKQALLDEEQRRVKPSNLPVSSEDLALRAGRGRTRVSGSITCVKCGRKDHFAHDCLKSKSAKHHHRAKNAEKQEDSEFDSGGANEMFVAKVGLKASAQSSDWIIDSGASRHMTFEKNIL